MTGWWPFGGEPSPWTRADAEALADGVREGGERVLSAPYPDERETWLAGAANAVFEALGPGERPASLAVLAWDAEGETVMVSVGRDGVARREAGREAAG